MRLAAGIWLVVLTALLFSIGDWWAAPLLLAAAVTFTATFYVLRTVRGDRGSPSAIARESHAIPLEGHMKTVAALLAAVAIAALTLLPSTPAFATGHRIQINEIYYNSPGTDTGSNSSLNAEWVRLYNTSSSRISLTNWTVRDAARHIFKFGTYTLGGHSYVKIHTGHGTRTQTNRYWNQNWYIWNNTGDTAYLRDAGNHALQTCAWTKVGAGYKNC